MKPTVGRSVHYMDDSPPLAPGPFAATIVSVVPVSPNNHEVLEEHNYTVSLLVADVTGWHPQPNVPFAESYQPGCWSWPPRES